jgi:hypothetical protein
MRLIDADELKKAIEKSFEKANLSEYELCICVCEIYDKCIDNAPTVIPEDFMNFTDLDRKVIADSINYLLGAELLEENGYTEEVVNSLKSVLQKIGSEENHL